MSSKRGVDISRAVVCGRQRRVAAFLTMGRQAPLQMSMKRKTSPVSIICFFIEWIFHFPASLLYLDCSLSSLLRLHLYETSSLLPVNVFAFALTKGWVPSEA